MATPPKPPVAITTLLRQCPYPLIVSDLETRTVLGANDAAYELLGRTPPSIEGLRVTEIMGEADWPAVEASMGLLASGALEGIQALRTLRKGDGEQFAVNIWVRAANVDGRLIGLVVLNVKNADIPWRLTEDRVTIAGVLTDHDWTIEMVSSDIEMILGVGPEDYKGRPLLGLLHPLDVQNLMSAVGRITSDGGGATLRVHLRDAKGRWQDVLLLMVAMCRHSPPRLGLAITKTESEAGMASESHQQLAARGGDVLGGVDQFRFSSPPGRFSARQSEILTRLLRGERVQEIANQMHLSPSTVRNHLTAIYRKFAVHSQTELFAKLLKGESLP
jgi:DNA-binding CsgD family transcriptional regulator